MPKKRQLYFPGNNCIDSKKNYILYYFSKVAYKNIC